MKATSPKIPFGVPNSVRPLNPAIPLGSTMGFANIDPLIGNAPAVPVSNAISNFFWEYTWHCHILGHEENDMMRPISLIVTSAVPQTPTGAQQIRLAWNDTTPASDPATMGNPANEIGLRIERAVGPGSFAKLALVPANSTSYADSTVVALSTNRYRLFAQSVTAATLSKQVTGLPSGRVTVYVRLWTQLPTGWQYTDYTYTSRP